MRHILYSMNPVEAHYAQPGLMERIQHALAESGLNPEHLQQSDLAKLDHFHVGGADATDALIRLAHIQPTDTVLDLGSGIGGPSRHLAATVGCHVTGVDLTDEYCQVATMLASSTGLSHLVAYQRGDALATPFDDAAFDVVWTQHAAMNIEDKAGLYREIFRVLKTGGRLALHDVVAGAGPVLYPVPWASRAELSFLMTEPDMQTAIVTAGFRHIVSQDVTSGGVEALSRVATRAGAPGFSLRTLMGDEFPVMLANLTTNLKSGTVRLVQSVYEK
jgi:ubiquinone/menaquinone biosynthesis C-methylase UbiE